MRHRTAIGFVIGLLAAVFILSGGTPKQVKTQILKQSAPPAVPGGQGEKKDWLTAQQWLKSIGYDVTIDQMKTMKRLVLQQYSLKITPLINDKTMRHVRLLTGLESISLPRQIGDEGLQYIAGLKELRSVNMPDCKVTDQGLRYLSGLSKLKKLVLANPRIHDTGLTHLRGLPLIILNLNQSKVTDAGIAMLRGMPIQKLLLVGTAITDGCIRELVTHRGTLERLDITGTAITEAGRNQLRSAMPSLVIH